MSTTVARTVIVGNVASIDKKRVNDKNLAEFRVDDLGIKINAWGDLAVKVPEPGKLVLVEGKIVTRKYQKDGQDRYSTEITASSVEALSTARPAAAPAPADDEFGDELPF